MVGYVFQYTATFLNLEACEKNKEEESLVDQKAEFLCVGSSHFS